MTYQIGSSDRSGMSYSIFETNELDVDNIEDNSVLIQTPQNQNQNRISSIISSHYVYKGKGFVVYKNIQTKNLKGEKYEESCCSTTYNKLESWVERNIHNGEVDSKYFYDVGYPESDPKTRPGLRNCIMYASEHNKDIIITGIIQVAIYPKQIHTILNGLKQFGSSRMYTSKGFLDIEDYLYEPQLHIFQSLSDKYFLKIQKTDYIENIEKRIIPKTVDRSNLKNNDKTELKYIIKPNTNNPTHWDKKFETYHMIGLSDYLEEHMGPTETTKKYKISANKMASRLNTMLDKFPTWKTSGKHRGRSEFTRSVVIKIKNNCYYRKVNGLFDDIEIPPYVPIEDTPYYEEFFKENQ
eukprot:TRINITY_DN5413_c0_g1_i1.p1 TRINITY_DN5413_c0_g1~~TRINITY_DN5413_c0_g1_i1.p1  ORF type:complete len:398 (-),score=62.37 TRINITY_DN5413_c0_g1_i1:101-1159(-)